MSQLSQAVSFGWDKMCNGIDSIATFPIHIISHFSNKCYHIISDQHGTQAKVMALFFFSSAALQVTLANPWLPTSVGYPAGIIALPLLSRLVSQLKIHIDDCKDQLASKDKVVCVASTMVSTAIQTSLVATSLYFMDDKIDCSHLGMTLALWTTSFNGWINVFVSGSMLHELYNKNGQDTLEAESGLMMNCKKCDRELHAIEYECLALADDIEYLKSDTKKLDRFIKKRPELLAVVKKNINLYREYIADGVKPLSDDEFNTDDPIDRSARLAIERNTREHFFNERIDFIRRHQEVYDCFKKYVDLAQEQEKNQLLLLIDKDAQKM